MSDFEQQVVEYFDRDDYADDKSFYDTAKEFDLSDDQLTAILINY